MISFSTVGLGSDWTFTGIGTTVQSAHDPGNPVQLTIRDNAGLLPPLHFATEFIAELTLGTYMAFPFGKGGYATIGYRTAGHFEFVQGSQTLLRCTITPPPGELSTWITKGPFGWIGNSSGGYPVTVPTTAVVVWEWLGESVPAYGLYPGQSVAAFGLRINYLDMNTGGNPLIPLLPSSAYPAVQWVSHAQLEANATFIPNPGSWLVVVAGALVMRRMRPPA